MFFPERIKNIRGGDRVLEIGPGSSPFPRADVLLERRYSSDEEYRLQCGDDGMQGVDRRTVYYDGEEFPFDDGEFDYVICSHVLEHVPNVVDFCAEIFRVGRAGYFEYPLFYYEYIYDFPVHVNILKNRGGELVYLPKVEIMKSEGSAVRDFWRETLNAGHTSVVRELASNLIEGFEWTERFGVRRAVGVSELLHYSYEIPKPAHFDCGGLCHLRGFLGAVRARLSRNLNFFNKK